MPKKVEREIEIAATPKDVWRALSEGEELKRWFPLDARVKPGAGGSVWLSWGEGAEWESPIEIWEPNRRMQTVDTFPGQDGAPPTRIAVDYVIEARGGTTVVRLVHSGFADDTWEDELETMGAGWTSFLANLKHYLERHKGEPRTIAHFRHPLVGLERRDVFPRMLKLLGLDASKLRAGERYSTTARSGDRFEGRAIQVKEPINFTATAENWGNAFLMIEIEPGRGRCRPAI